LFHRRRILVVVSGVLGTGIGFVPENPEAAGATGGNTGW